MEQHVILKFRAILGSRERLAALRAVFDDFDTDGDGTLTEQELKLGLDQLAAQDEAAAADGEKDKVVVISGAEIPTLFQVLDEDGSGSLDFDGERRATLSSPPLW
jgi:Ca2+-binding EF-hand superfamily protein